MLSEDNVMDQVRNGAAEQKTHHILVKTGFYLNSANNNLFFPSFRSFYLLYLIKCHA